MEYQKEYPRLVNFIRAHGSISAPWSENPDSPDAFNKKKLDRSKKNERWKNLDMLKEYLTKFSTFPHSDIKEIISELIVLCKEVAGSDSSTDFIEGSVIFLIELFRDSKLISKQQTLKLKEMYGSYSVKTISKIHMLSRKIVDSLSPSVVEEFISNGFPMPKEDLLEEMFGNKIKFVDSSPFNDSFCTVPYNSTQVPRKKSVKLSFKYETQPLPPSIENVSKPPKSKSSVKKFDQHWLQESLFQSLQDSSAADVCASIMVMLKSPKTNEELQNELFDLLGFDRISLIEDILKHRDKIGFSKVIDTSTKDILEKKPVCMSQVIIQSETEKLLQKQNRKDERRIQREKERMDDAMVLHCQKLTQIREQELIKAQNTPIFRNGYEESVVNRQRICSPHIFDSHAEVRMSASLISGKKLCLPENAVRTNNKIFEEIHIPQMPRTDSILKKFESKRRLIEEEDEIIQLGFKGFKSLNAIQSDVFETAYNSNQNILFCAPTGAGKTNVAMLTVLREIKNNIENGILQKNKFKIVYVAPMKALASEMVKNFGSRLKALGENVGLKGIVVKELTGDMQLTKKEISETQMIITTPEKWDVVTRKSTGDIGLSQLVRLLILDEVHLLDGDRGPVLEAIVARTLRQVVISQNMIRIVGLSATLPNYRDVASFLSVDPNEALFFFDDRFRPVPLSPTFIGVKAHNLIQAAKDMDVICYQKVLKFVENYQVMVFVHTRNATFRTATILKELALQNNEIGLFAGSEKANVHEKDKTRNKQLKELLEYGFAIHHAGMLRSDRNLVEKLFSKGSIKVLVCTSTLAWGVNLPAHAVIIKGTEIYNSNQGSFMDLGVLDVMQIFGRAGRPQFDKKGEGIIITAHEKLYHYLSILTRQHQIESKFGEKLADNLNAEICLGTVTNVNEAVDWLKFTYYYVRMQTNPLAYGIKPNLIVGDPALTNHRKNLIEHAARNLDKAGMIRFDPECGFLRITNKGRTSSHYYISTESVLSFNQKLQRSCSNEAEILKIIALAEEFKQLKFREDEAPELDHLLHQCYYDVPLGFENTEGKINILLQSYLSRIHIEGFSLLSDQSYIIQNATRIVRALFEVCLYNRWALPSPSFLNVAKMLERRMWGTGPPVYQSPLHQFPELGTDVLNKIDRAKISIDALKELEADELGQRVRCFRERYIIKKCLEYIPNLGIVPIAQPITDTILRITLNIHPDFEWSDKHHGLGSEMFWIWISDPETDDIHHSEYFILPRKQVKLKEVQTLIFTIPLSKERKPSQYLIRVISDRWLGSDREFSVPFRHLILPQHHQPHTDLLNLNPLPVEALKNKDFEQLYKFDYFNPIQTQIFHTLYNTDHNVLLGAPTGSGKTIAAEIAMFRVFKEYPGTKIVYIAPLKALVRERIDDWKIRFERKLKKKVVELTGDVTPDASAIATADIIVTTPEKWDGVSRSWQTRNYVKAVSLIAIDEIHLLGEDRGPVLEVIVSRTNFISNHTERKLRIVGLSTALANACDIGNWLGIKEVGLYNFRSSVRPVQLEIHVSGSHGKHYCPRMATMNKPTYQAIQQHSPDKPALIFVSSRRQTRLTAQDLISYLCSEDRHEDWRKHMKNDELNNVIDYVQDQNLKFTLAFGIGLHHAGLHEKDRKTVEELFLNQKIQVLIATATLAWGINLPAHLVIVKGTEYYDAKVNRYVDFPITDVMQMCGRAGRPQFDTSGVAVVLVHDVKKDFYKKFLHDSFPVESSLIKVLPEHINAEVVAGTINTKQQCLDYITWTYFFRRLLQNPTFYALESVDGSSVNELLSGLINQCLQILSEAGCLTVDDDERTVCPTVLGKIASYYYLNHKTILVFIQKLHANANIEEIIQILCDADEYEELPVRHNEDAMNKDLSVHCPIKSDEFSFDNPHTKANLLLQAHFSRLPLPCTDYYTDLKSVLDQAIRIIQAMIDISADRGWLSPALLSMSLLQMILQARWHDDCTLLTLPHVERYHLPNFKFSFAKSSEVRKILIECLPQLITHVASKYDLLGDTLRGDLDDIQIQEIHTTLKGLPVIQVKASIKGWWNDSNAEETRKLNIGRRINRGERPISDWLSVHADQEYVLTVQLHRISKPRMDTKAIAPKFPKQKSEGWFLVLGSDTTNELIAMKRIPYIAKSATHQLLFYTPPKEVGNISYKLYLISDSYLGLDQEYTVCLNILEASLQAQFNTEVLSDSDDTTDEET